MDHSDTLPPDIFAVAVGIARDLPARVQPANRDFAANVIARAIMAERERCAKAAEEIGKAYGEDEAGWLDCSETIAKAIRGEAS